MVEFDEAITNELFNNYYWADQNNKLFVIEKYVSKYVCLYEQLHFAFEKWVYRKTLKISWCDHITNTNVL